MKKFNILIILFTLLFGIKAVAQTGSIEGNVFEIAEGNVQELLPSAKIVEITPDGSAKLIGLSDFNGHYHCDLTPGIHKIVFKYSGLLDDTTTFDIKPNSIITHNQEMSSKNLVTINVVAKRGTDKATEITTVKETKESEKVVTIQTKSEMDSKGVSDIGGAAEKMTGLSTVGSVLYVRGLGDRYNVAYLNGLPIPSPHPDFRVVPLSVFPTDIVNSVQVSKVMSSELYGDFSGGAFNITTRSYYEKPTLKVSLGTGANTQTTFKDFRTYEGGKLDYFGFDDGTRAIPEEVINSSKKSAYPAVNDIYESGLYRSVEGKETKFRDNFGTKLQTAMPNTSFSVTGGNFYPATKSKSKSSGVGFLVLLAHDNSMSYSDGSLKIINAQSEERLNYDFEKYNIETSTTGLLNLYFRLNPKNNISFNTLFVNNSNDETRETWGSHSDYVRNIYSRRLTYQQNYMSVNQIIGTHELLPNANDSSMSRLTLDWRASYSLTGSQEPDRRQFVAFFDDKEDTDSYAFNYIDRNENHIFHSQLNENEIAGKFNAKYVLKYGEYENKKGITKQRENITLKVGADYKNKTRSFDYKQYNYVVNELANDLGNNLDIYDINSQLNSDVHDKGGFYIDEVANFGSSYIASLQVTSGYADLKFKTNKWTIIPGLRFESGFQSVENRNQQSPSKQEKTILLSNAILPSLITRYEISENDVLRFVASKTLTRPKFNEVAPFQYVLYFAGAKAQGNTQLQNGTNYNLDFRYEHYMKPGEMISLGGFYKYLDNPIEQTMRATASGQLMSFANANSANVAGAEFEYMRNLDFLTQKDSSILKYFRAGLNASYMFTSVQIDTTDGGTINTNSRRPLEGASPYLINFDLRFQRKIGNRELGEKSFLAALSDNVFGPRLFGVGSNGIGDQYQQPVNSLNFVGKISFNDTYSIGLKAKNLLNPTINIVQEDQVNIGETLNVSSYKRGLDLSLSFSYNIPVAKKAKEKVLD